MADMIGHTRPAVTPWDGTEADLDRYLADCQALSRRLDEQSLILGLGWSASVCLTHEATLPWDSATAGRWYRALPERWFRDVEDGRVAEVLARLSPAARERVLAAAPPWRHPALDRQEVPAP
jgi:hypothetical protein